MRFFLAFAGVFSSLSHPNPFSVVLLFVVDTSVLLLFIDYKQETMKRCSWRLVALCLSLWNHSLTTVGGFVIKDGVSSSSRSRFLVMRTPSSGPIKHGSSLLKVLLDKNSETETGSATSNLSEEDDPEEIRRQIEKMRQEAIARLDRLESQVKEQMLKQKTEISTEGSSTETRTGRAVDKREPAAGVSSSRTSVQGTQSETKKTDPASDLVIGEETIGEDEDDEDVKYYLSMVENIPQNDITLLQNTRWKIVFNIGREPGTWMPKEWGVSGDRLRLEIVVDLTDEQCYEPDDFLQGRVDTYKLRVVDAFLFPHGTGAQSHGRQKVKIQKEGAYKVVRRMGPLDTDILRLYVELDELIARGDLYCPKGRIYGTCGYFPTHSDRAIEMNQWKERLAKLYHQKVVELDDLKREAEVDSRLFSMDQLKRMKRMMDLNAEIRKIAQRQRETRARMPEKQDLRLSRQGNVGLSREGGVCCKVRKGMAVEYHILGRMEMASVEKKREFDEEYDDLLKKLHP